MHVKMSTATSFQKKSRVKAPQISGTRPSIHNNQLLVSSGIPSLDHVLGGGLAVGTVCLVEEDVYASYSRMVLKYFVAEGIMCRHGLLLASADLQCQQLLKELPGPVMDDPGRPTEGSADASSSATPSSESMSIAWRYQNQPQVQSSSGVSKFGHYYDLTKTMDRTLIDTAKKTLIDVDCHTDQQKCPVIRPCYQKVLSAIKSEIEAGGYGTNVTSQQRNILRVGLHSLGSPLWGEEAQVSGSRHDMAFDAGLPRFLYALRALLRTSYSVCLITVPTHLFKDPGFVSRLRHLVDTVVRLESFAGTVNEKNPAYKEYHGLFKLEKLPRLNSLTCHMPDTLDLAFKLRRKKFMIERLHLPPELSETASRDQEDPDKPVKGPGSLCATNTKSKLDF